MIDTPISHQLQLDFKELQQQLKKAAGDPELFQSIVNAPFDQKIATTFMFLGIMVLLLVNDKTKTIDRLALSNTPLAKNTTEVSVVPFEKIKIPLNAENNIIAQAIQLNQPQDTTDWRFLFHPALTAEQARINQASAGIAYSAVHPLNARNGGALIFSYFQYRQGIGDPQKAFMKKYASLASKYLSA